MVSDLTWANTFVIGVLLVGAGSGWALAEFAGPVDEVDAEPLFPEEPEILVLYPTHVVRVATVTIPFDSDGRAVFDPVPVETRNITKVSVRMHVTMDDIAPRDRFEVDVTAPDATERDADTEASPSIVGYKLSQTVVQEWPRKVAPGPTTYITHEPETALHWSAENHTDTRSTGDWSVVVGVTPPGNEAMPRDGTVRLDFTFVAYEAVAFPNWEPNDLETLGGNNTTTPDDPSGTSGNSRTAPEDGPRETPPLAPRVLLAHDLSWA